MQCTTDDVLWGRMRAGDVLALGDLFDRHSSRVHMFCARLVGDGQVADDLLSECFLEAWRSRGAFRVQNGSAMPILLAIARRICQKYQRGAARRERVAKLMRQARVPAGEDPAERVVGNELEALRRAWLRQQVEAMPIQFRDVVELVLYAELSYDEVAELLQVPLGTVKSRMARARRLIDAGHRTCPIDERERMGEEIYAYD